MRPADARWFRLGLLAFLLHLVDEHFTGMWRDPVVSWALTSSSTGVEPPRALYAVFQATLFVSIVMLLAFDLGGRWRTAVVAGWALALLAESHHLLRALFTLQSNSGLLTALPMPVLGALSLRASFQGVRP